MKHDERLLLLEKEQNNIHAAAASGVGISLPEDPLSGCVPKGGSSAEDKPVRSQSSGNIRRFQLKLADRITAYRL